MLKEEIWSVSIQRAGNFFREQEDVTEETDGSFLFKTCRITLTELEPAGIWAVRRTKLRIEGGADDAEHIYRRYFLQFLSAGG